MSAAEVQIIVTSAADIYAPPRQGGRGRSAAAAE